MTGREYDKSVWADFESRIKGSDFKNHSARCIDLTDVLAEMKLIMWRQPHESNYAVNYMIWRNRLIVTGDLGEAIFVWGETVDLKFLVGCDYSYFISKCQGIDGHQKLRQWDPDRVKVMMEEWLVENPKPDHDIDGWENHSGSYEEWGAFAHENDLLRPEEPYNWGYTYHYRAVAIWLGLRLAAEALKPIDTEKKGG